jgi:hypothetical protein
MPDAVSKDHEFIHLRPGEHMNRAGFRMVRGGVEDGRSAP